MGRDSETGVVYGDAQRVLPAPASHDHAPTLRVPDRIRHEVAQNALHQNRIALHESRAAKHSQIEPFGARLRLEFHARARQQRRQREHTELRADGTGIELRDVQQRAEHLVHDLRALAHLAEQCTHVPRQIELRERTEIEIQRMDGLAQIVARRRKEAGLGEVGGLRRILLHRELPDQLHVLQPQPHRFDEQPVERPHGAQHYDGHHRHADGHAHLRSAVLQPQPDDARHHGRQHEREVRGVVRRVAEHRRHRHHHQREHEGELVDHLVRRKEEQRAESPQHARYERREHGLAQPAGCTWGSEGGASKAPPPDHPHGGEQRERGEPPI